MFDKLIIFDLDDTLIDTIGALEVARRELILHVGQVPSPEILNRWQRASHYFDSEDFENILNVVFPEKDFVPEAAERLRDIYWGHEVANVAMKPGACAVMEALMERGAGMAMVTNGPREKQAQKLERLNLFQYFQEGEMVVYADGLSVPKKPHPFALEQVLAACGMAPGQAHYVGDSKSDVLAANLAGISSIKLISSSLRIDAPDGPHELSLERPGHCISELHELLSIID